MSEEIESFKDYWEEVQGTALIELEETEEHIELEGMELTDSELIESAAEYCVDAANIVRNNWRTVIYFTDNGFGGLGYERYIRNREFEDNDPREMAKALAKAAYYNDVRDVIEDVLEIRDDLGEALGMIQGPIFSEGVELEYIYTRNTVKGDVDYTFTLEHLGSGEWRIRDPDGESFNVISPKVHVTQSDNMIDVQSLQVWLNNFCARRLRETNSE